LTFFYDELRLTKYEIRQSTGLSVIEQAESASDLVRQQNVDRILDCAERLFRQYGYAKTNVADIARDLEMSPANIYRFFPSKSAIHQALAERILNVLYRNVWNIFHLDISVCDRLRRYAQMSYDYTVEMMVSDNKVYEMVLVAMEQHWTVVKTHMDRVLLLMQNIIREGIEAGEFPEQDEIVAARCLSSSLAQMCHPVLVAQCRGDGHLPSVSELIEFSLNSLKYNSSCRAV
jgi:AcrR family transcriptional regulator